VPTTFSTSHKSIGAVTAHPVSRRADQRANNGASIYLEAKKKPDAYLTENGKRGLAMARGRFRWKKSGWNLAPAGTRACCKRAVSEGR